MVKFSWTFLGIYVVVNLRYVTLIRGLIYILHLTENAVSVSSELVHYIFLTGIVLC